MKILQLIEGDGGGAVTNVLMLAKELPHLNFRTYIVFLTQGSSAEMAKSLGLNYEVIQCKFFPDVFLLWKLWQIMRKNQIDAGHTHTIRGNFYGRIATLLSRKRTVSITTVHSFLIDELGGLTKAGIKQRLLYKRETSTHGLVDHFILVSKGLRDKLLGDGIPEAKLTHIPHGIPLPNLEHTRSDDNSIRSEFNIGKDKVLIGIIARLVPVKNHKLFFVAAEKVLKIVTNVVFLIVGDGPLRKELEQLANELGITEFVIFTGWRNDIEECLKAIDVLVLCSTTESQGLVILEAMSFGKPVIATDVNEIGESVIDGETGLLISPNDVNALTEAILRLVRDTDLAKRIGEGGRSLVEKEYSLERMVKRTADLYKEIYYKKFGVSTT
jgi:glycosyltransferase involved in cell wall biosynthesis